MKEKEIKSRIPHTAVSTLMAALAVFGTIALISCDTPTGGGGGVNPGGGSGTIKIGLNLGNASKSASRTAIPDSAELAGITLKVHLTGPGGTIDRDFGPQGGSIDLASGSWNITVKAYNSEPRLRGIADQSITVTPGGSQDILVTSAIGVKSEAELLDVADTFTGRFRYNDSDLSRENLIVVEADFDLNGPLIISDSGFPNPRKYTIIAEPGTTRTIRRRDGSGTAAFISMDDGVLSLGRAGETGSLVIDGLGVDYSSSGSAFLYIYTNASLIIDGNTEITRMEDSSVGGTIWCDSLVEMRGGKITNCANSDDGGAVTIRSGGRFVMSGGEISGNTAPNGGGVAMTDDGVFEMSGGTIGGNSALRGGGVYLAENTSAWDLGNRYFTMSGGEISGNTASDGGGVYLGAISAGLTDINRFIMTGGNISSTATSWGSGVFVDDTTIFAKRGGTITSTDPTRDIVIVYGAGKERKPTAGPDVRLYYDGTASTFIDPIDGYNTISNWN